MSTDNRSPQNRLHRSEGYRPVFSTPNRSINMARLGTENQTVNCLSRMNRSGLSSVWRDGQQTQAPSLHATNMSKTDRSKVVSKVCEKRSSGVISYRSVIVRTKCAALRCVTGTPFGVPVEPEVNSR